MIRTSGGLAALAVAGLLLAGCSSTSQPRAAQDRDAVEVEDDEWWDDDT